MLQRRLQQDFYSILTMMIFDPKRGGLPTRKRRDIQNKRLREIKLLQEAGWKRAKCGDWINPRSQRQYDEYTALSIEELRRSFGSKRKNI